MSPVQLWPPPPPNRQPLWLFWTRRYIGLALMHVAAAFLGAANQFYRQAERRPSWIVSVASAVFKLGIWISPRAPHVSMMRQPESEREDS
jgi:hypothetical protein